MGACWQSIWLQGYAVLHDKPSCDCFGSQLKTQHLIQILTKYLLSNSKTNKCDANGGWRLLSFIVNVLKRVGCSSYAQLLLWRQTFFASRLCWTKFHSLESRQRVFVDEWHLCDNLFSTDFIRHQPDTSSQHWGNRLQQPKVARGLPNSPSQGDWGLTWFGQSPNKGCPFRSPFWPDNAPHLTVRSIIVDENSYKEAASSLWS